MGEVSSKEQKNALLNGFNALFKVPVTEFCS